MINKKRIKPCPFCGEMPSVIKSDMSYGAGRGYPGCTEIGICCKNKSCYIRPSIYINDIYKPKKDETVMIDELTIMWNKRKEN